jgi:lipoprotein NlpD
MNQMNNENSFLMKKCLLILTVAIMSACSSTPNRAPVIERSTEIVNPITSIVNEEKKLEVRPTYTVKRGDTLVRIAQENGKSYADILSWNSINNPNDIKVGQLIWMGPIDGTGGSKTSIVNVNSGIEIRSLTPINPATNKTEPRGEKLAYSEENLAELQKIDLGTQATLAKVEVPTPEVKSVVIINWIWPTEGKVAEGFDEKKNKGINILGKSGQNVIATADGKVMFAGSAYRGYGNMLIIQHSNNFLSAYAHNKVLLVKEGQYVTKGQKIAEMGNSDSAIVKLHFEIRQAGKPVDPMKYLPSK